MISRSRVDGIVNDSECESARCQDGTRSCGFNVGIARAERLERKQENAAGQDQGYYAAQREGEKSIAQLRGLEEEEKKRHLDELAGKASAGDTDSDLIARASGYATPEILKLRGDIARTQAAVSKVINNKDYR
ncbi:hypothetical protein [Bradyrhizobium uaiense]|uniref:Uncharacterized protein n=1 Tax=Bradyrhizobium uaiense TaxID=2594946 RepID=A0A6P1BUD8_9BRAD|nr:hypothetical protein [Bradyrhizobium uaiense]NEV02148.1 hypothetical protein [Bradyrhizobium uaiense]